jgi:hypothetical protein
MIALFDRVLRRLLAVSGRWSAVMAKVLVLYYSNYGHIERMAHAEAEGARMAGAGVFPSSSRTR